LGSKRCLIIYGLTEKRKKIGKERRTLNAGGVQTGGYHVYINFYWVVSPRWGKLRRPGAMFRSLGEKGKKRGKGRTKLGLKLTLGRKRIRANQTKNKVGAKEKKKTMSGADHHGQKGTIKRPRRTVRNRRD